MQVGILTGACSCPPNSGNFPDALRVYSLAVDRLHDPNSGALAYDKGKYITALSRMQALYLSASPLFASTYERTKNLNSIAFLKALFLFLSPARIVNN